MQQNGGRDDSTSTAKPCPSLVSQPSYVVRTSQGVYFFFIKTSEGHPGAVYATLASKFVPTLAANWCIWPLAHLVNFKYVAPGYRIL